MRDRHGRVLREQEIRGGPSDDRAATNDHGVGAFERHLVELQELDDGVGR